MVRDVDLQKTHTVLFRSPINKLKINTLSQKLDLRSQLKEWYQDASSVHFGHSLTVLSPKQTSWNRDNVFGRMNTHKVSILPIF